MAKQVAYGPTGTVFQNQPNQILSDYDLVKSGDVRVDELTVVVDFSSKIRIAFVRGLEDDLHRRISAGSSRTRIVPAEVTFEPLVSLWVAR